MWYVIPKHLHGEEMGLGSSSYLVESDGCIGDLPEEDAQRCRSMPTVFREVADEPPASEFVTQPEDASAPKTTTLGLGRKQPK